MFPTNHDVTCRCSQQIKPLKKWTNCFHPAFFWGIFGRVCSRELDCQSMTTLKQVRVAIMTVFHVRSTRDFRGLSMPQASYATIKRSQRGGTTDFAIAPGEAVPQWKEGRRSWTLSLVAATRQRLREGYNFIGAGTCWYHLWMVYHMIWITSYVIIYIYNYITMIAYLD